MITLIVSAATVFTAFIVVHAGILYLTGIQKLTVFEYRVARIIVNAAFAFVYYSIDFKFTGSICLAWVVFETIDLWRKRKKKRKLLQKLGYKAKLLIAKMKSSSAFKSGRPAIPVPA